MKNVTITLDENVARWARIWAAKKDTSLSRLVGEMLREKMEQEEGYEAARRTYFSLPSMAPRDPEQPYPGRDEIHER